MLLSTSDLAQIAVPNYLQRTALSAECCTAGAGPCRLALRTGTKKPAPLDAQGGWTLTQTCSLRRLQAPQSALRAPPPPPRHPLPPLSPPPPHPPPPNG